VPESPTPVIAVTVNAISKNALTAGYYRPPGITSLIRLLFLYCLALPAAAVTMGVEKQVIRAGNGVDMPEKNDEVSIAYTGTILDAVIEKNHLTKT
jgi:hypothetical protein